MRYLRALPIAIRLWSMVALALCGFILMLASEVHQLGTDVSAARQGKVRSAVEAAHSVLAYYAAQAQAGAMSTEAAQSAARQAIAAIRYGDGDYLWLNTMDGVMVMHPTNPALDGKPILDIKDPTGKAFFADMIALVQTDGEGSITYLWPKPGSDAPEPKISYVKGFAPWGWLVGSGVYVDDIDRMVRGRAVERGLTVLVGIVLLVVLSLAIARSISGPLQALTACMRGLAKGELGLDVPARGMGPEIDEMAEAVQVFKDNALEVRRLERASHEAKARADAERRSMLLNLAEGFEASVQRVVRDVSQAAHALRDTAESMSAVAVAASQRSTSAATAVTQANANVQTVAVATEELSASINDIGGQVDRSTAVSRDAVDAAQRADAIVRGLSEAAGRIGEVVGLIEAIAGQTNLLALNATIEAARAGDSGKGFAVVAGEVKALATQTAKATSDITRQIAAIQQATQDAVGAIGRVGGTIAEVSTIAAVIAAAVEQQGAATREISQSAHGVAQSTQNVSDDVHEVNKAATMTGDAAGQVLTQAGRLAEEAAALHNVVAGFLAEVRAA